MNQSLIVNFINLLTNILMILILVRVVLSWIPGGGSRLREIINDLTEPLLLPIRKVIPLVGGVLDLSPIVAYLILYLIQIVVNAYL